MKEPKCLNCGKCCRVKNECGKWVDCRFLVRYGTGRTRCSIYHHRIDAIVGCKQVCIPRKNLPWDIKGCPYNTGKAMHPGDL